MHSHSRCNVPNPCTRGHNRECQPQQNSNGSGFQCTRKILKTGMQLPLKISHIYCKLPAHHDRQATLLDSLVIPQLPASQPTHSTTTSRAVSRSIQALHTRMTSAPQQHSSQAVLQCPRLHVGFGFHHAPAGGLNALAAREPQTNAHSATKNMPYWHRCGQKCKDPPKSLPLPPRCFYMLLTIIPWGHCSEASSCQMTITRQTAQLPWLGFKF